MNEQDYKPIAAPTGWIWAEAFRQLGLAGRTVRGWLTESGAAFHLGDADVLALWVVLRCQVDGADQRQLADAIGVSPAQVSGLVERLGGQGLIASVRPERDRRRQVWRLTAQGESTLGSVLHELEQRATAADALHATELTRLLTLLARWPAAHATKQDGARVQGDGCAAEAAASLRHTNNTPVEGRTRPSLRVLHEEDAA